MLSLQVFVVTDFELPHETTDGSAKRKSTLRSHPILGFFSYKRPILRDTNIVRSIWNQLSNRNLGREEYRVEFS